MIELWVLTLLDLARSLVEEHTQKEARMTNSNFVRLSGWSLMLASVTFFLFFAQGIFIDDAQGLDASLDALYVLSYWTFLACSLLLAVGLLGLRSRYGGTIGSFGKGVLLVGAVAGPAVTLFGVFREAMVHSVWTLLVLFAGSAVSLACLALFGVVTLSRRPLPRWNGLPFLAGVFYPAVALISTIPAPFDGNLPASTIVVALMDVVTLGLFTVTSLALFMLGYVLQADAPGQPVPA